MRLVLDEQNGIDALTMELVKMYVGFSVMYQKSGPEDSSDSESKPG